MNYLKICSLLLFCFFLIIYSQTVSPYPQNIADSTELTIAAFTKGIAHPPSYPLYIFIGYLFQQLPFFQNPAQALNFLSSIFQSLALAVFFLTCFNLQIIVTKTKIPKTCYLLTSLFATLILGFSYFFWDQATIAEVFPLHTVFSLTTIYLILKNIKKFEARRNTYIFALFGLSASHHQTILFLLPAYLYLLTKNKKLKTNFWSNFSLALISFLLPFLLLFIFNNPVSPLSWYFDKSLTGFWQLITRGIYSQQGSAIENLANNFNLNHSLFSILLLLKYVISHLTLPAIILAFSGLYYLYKKGQSIFNYFLITLIISGPLLAFYLKFPLIADSSDPQYFLGTYLRLRMFILFEVILALLIPIGFTYQISSFKFLNSQKKLCLIILISLILPGLMLWQNYKIVNKKQANFDAYFYSSILKNLPQKSILIIDSDMAFGILYSQIIDKERTDVLIIPTTVHMRWQYLQKYLPPEIFKIKGYFQLIDTLLLWSLNSKRPVFVFDPSSRFADRLNQFKYFITPSGYTLKIDVKPEKITNYDYGLSLQLTKTKISTKDLWSRGGLGNLSIIHSLLAYYYAKNGSIAGAKQHLLLAKNLVQNERNFKFIEQIEKSILN